MTCFTGEKVAEVAETALDISLIEDEGPHGNKVEDVSEIEVERQRETKGRGREKLPGTGRLRNPTYSTRCVSEVICIHSPWWSCQMTTVHK